VQILVLVARSLTEIITEDDRSGERFRVAAHCDVGQSALSRCAETALNESGLRTLRGKREAG